MNAILILLLCLSGDAVIVVECNHARLQRRAEVQSFIHCMRGPTIGCQTWHLAGGVAVVAESAEIVTDSMLVFHACTIPLAYLRHDYNSDGHVDLADFAMFQRKPRPPLLTHDVTVSGTKEMINP